MISTLANTAVEDVQIHFFTAKPTHLGYDKQIRHQNYLKALKATGAKIYEGRFKTELEVCKMDCKLAFDVWKEKQTDVAIATYLLYYVQQNPEDKFFLLTMDTDQIPVVRLVRQKYPRTPFVWVIPPSKNAPGEAKGLLDAKQFIYLHWQHLRQSQFNPAEMKQISGKH